MKIKKLIRSILLAFLFFFIGRFIVLQMGEIGYWIVGGLVIAFYVVWYFWGRWSKNENDN